MRRKGYRVVLLTGDSSGFGKAMVPCFVRNGDHVYGVSRHPFEAEGLTHFCGDISSKEDIRRIVSAIVEKEGRIDILINNAGYGIFSAVEDTSLEEAKKLFDVNLFGALNVTQEALPSIRKSRMGKILNISSIASEIPLPFQGFYSAGKSAMDALFDALRSEIRPFGIAVVSIRPGDAKTGFTANRRILGDADSLYGARLLRSLRSVEKDEQGGFAPAKVASKAFSVSMKRRPKEVYRVGWKDRFLTIVFHLLPRRARSYLLYRIYAE